MMNSLICSLFLSVRFVFSLFGFNDGYITDSQMSLINAFCFILIIILIINIYFAFGEKDR